MTLFICDWTKHSMSQLGRSLTRFTIWGKEHAQFISLMGLTAGSVFYVGGAFFVLRSDLQSERELRQQDAAHYKEMLHKEKELRRLAVERSKLKSGGSH